MKKYTTLIILVMFSSSFSIFAQTSAPEKFTISFKSIDCYPKAIFPQLEDALDMILYKTLGFEFCAGTCPFSSVNSCTANLTNQAVVLTEDPNSWCFQGVLIFQWACIYTPPNPGGGNIIFDGDLLPASLAISGDTDNPTPSVEKVYPNPTTGQGYLVLNVPKDNSLVSIVTHNLLGQQLAKNNISDVDKSRIQIPFDLTANEQGIYIISVLVNDKLIDTIRLLIQ